MSLPVQTPTEAPTDEALVQLHLRGDSAAFDRLFDRYHGRVRGYAMKMLGRAELADEVCAETFVKILEGRWKPVGRFRAYLFTVAHRACLERLRRRRTALRFVPWLRLAPEPPTPEEDLHRLERQQSLSAAVARLSEEHRAVLLLYYAQELPSKEVASILGCSDQQVRSRLSYARRLLRDLLEEES